MTEVAIVGAGILGTALAAALVRRGRDVVLIDDRRPGTTATTFAWLNSHKKDPLDYHELNLAGVAAWRKVASALPGAAAFEGHVEVAHDEAHRASLDARVARLTGLGYRAQRIDPTQARSLAPVPIAHDAHAAWFPDEGHAFPLRWIARLDAELMASGRCTRILGDAQRVSERGGGAEVRLADGTCVAARVVVICAGNGSPALVTSAGGTLPLVPPVVDGAAFGYLADVAAPGHGITRIVTTDGASLRPGESSDLLMQALDLDAFAEAGVPAPPRVVAALESRVRDLLPHAHPTVERVRVGHRVIPADGRTAAGRIAPGSSVWTIVTHSGVVLAPWLSETIADEVCGADPDPRLSAFRPHRFIDGTMPRQSAVPRAPGDQ
jgi:glycine/D-amino acid oxidase-like deaminating enzyme